MPKIFNSEKSGVMVCSVNGVPGNITADGNYRTLLFNGVDTDPFGNYNSSTGLYTVSDPGYYFAFAAFADSESGHQSNNDSRIQICKNGSGQVGTAAISTLDTYASATAAWLTHYDLNDTISAKYAITWGGNTVTSFGPCFMTIMKLFGSI